MITDFTSDTFVGARGAEADKRAAPLRRAIEAGGSVRLTAFGHVQRRDRTGRVCGEYGRDVLELALAEGWLVEARRRETPVGVVVEYRLEGAPAVPEPEPAKRASKPKRVERTKRKPSPSASVGRPTDPPRRAEPKRRTVSRRDPSLPTSPQPLPDGTESLSVAAVAARYGVPEKTVRSAVRGERVDRGPGYLPEGYSGRPRMAVALTDRTRDYAAENWAPDPPRRVELPDGAEVLQRELTDALGLGRGPNVAAALEAVPNRYVVPGAPRRGRLYRVGHELVEAASALGRSLGRPVEVVLRPPEGDEAEPAVDPARWKAPEPKAGPWEGREVTLERGTELVQRELLAALGMRPTANNRATRALLPLRRKGHGNAWLYRVDDELVELLKGHGFAVTLTPPASVDQATEAERPAPSGDGHWSSLLPETRPVDTPHFV